MRELENTIERAVQLASSSLIEKKDLPVPMQIKQPFVATDSHNKIQEEEHRMIVKVLKESKGNVKTASEQLGIGRTTLYRKLAKYHIDRNRYRP
ncbi:MAG TPA: hypothetical protein DHN33_01415 [Eubacteriaceae bacterium]|nr:hypothetical protein [Eubacteriaceae bacterium]